MPEELKITHSGEAFLHYDIGEDDPERISFFVTVDNLDTLYNADSWYRHGTFSVCSQNFFQLYTVQAIVEGSVIPLAFALLPIKKEETYIKMLQAFKYYPNHVCLDFEIAASNAFRRLNKNVIVTYCLFHLGRSVFRQVQRLGLTQECTVVQFKQRIKMLTCLAFLPKEDVVLGFENLQVVYEHNEAIQPLLDYFEDIYIIIMSLF